MKIFCFTSTLVLSVLLGKLCLAQDFSNKGKDFWVAYGYHQVMSPGGGGPQNMVLYFAAEQNTNVTVTIPGVAYTQNYFVPANSVVTSNPIPKTGAQDVRLTAGSVTPENKGIHITSDKPIIAYAHIYNASVSGATILFPTATLGKEYYSINYRNISNTNNANCWFYVVAADTGTTTVEIKPSANAIGHPAGTPFTVNLTQGQVYNVMGELLDNSGGTYTAEDLTGSQIKSISSATGGCKRIAVFSGSGRISITCNSTASSSDNYMVQAFPKSAWGKKYLTAPTGGSSPNNIFRICVSTPSTLVTLNGSPITVPLTAGFYYEIDATSAPMRIEADQPIIVSQYLTSQGACGNGTPGDPEMIYLSPVEQNINKVLWNATGNFAITQHYYNVIIPNSGTALSSFRLDGVPVGVGAFTAHPQAPGYSYLTQNVFAGQHTIQSDSGFNAIAYGYGQAESYGYNAGTNIKDIYQFVSIANQYATVNVPSTCKNTPFNFSMTFPYQPTRIQWIFNGLFPDVDLLNPAFTSSSVVNGRTLYKYNLSGTYTIPNAGTYPIKVIASNPTPDGCGGIQEIDYDLQVFEPPVANFNFSTNGCVTSPVQFTDNSTGNGQTINNWYWNFGDGNFNNTLNNPTHTYSSQGAFTVKYAIRTDVGCISDTAIKVVNVNDLPIAKFGHTVPTCAGKSIVFSDTSSSSGPEPITKWIWDFGDGPPVLALTNANQVHTYSTPGVYTATLLVETNSGCRSIAFSRQLTISANPVAAFAVPNICLPSGLTQFTDQSTIIAPGTLASWSWDFGDGNNSTLQNPSHIYASTGPFTVNLTVTSTTGCTDTKTQAVTNIFAEPQAAFTAAGEVCLGSSIAFTDASTAAASSVTQWNWNFGDGNTSILQNPTHTYSAAGSYTVTLTVVSAAGCSSVNNIATRTVIVNPLPTVSFTNSPLLCEGTNIIYTSTSIPNAGVFTQYNWTVNSAPVGTNSPVLNHLPLAAGIFTVQLTAVTDKGCSNTSSSTVNVNAKPIASFALPSICLPTGIANFSSTSTISAGTISSWNWNFGDGNTANTAIATNNYTSAGPFNVTLTVVSNNGCSDDSMRVLNTVYAEPQAAFSSASEVCLGSALSFTDASTAAASTVTQWNWTFGDGNTSTQQNPSHTYATAGTYTVTLNVGSAAGCQTVNNIATRTIVVNALPTADFSIGSAGCVTRNINFTDGSAANSGSLVKWSWNFGDGNNSVLTSAGPVSHAYSTVGTYTVSLQVENNKGCISTVRTRSIVINSLPDADFTPPIACVNDVQASFVDLSSVSPGTISSWQWNFGDPNANAGNPNLSNLQNPTHHFTVAGSYTSTLVAVSNLGCTDTVKKTFFINGAVPQAGFTIQNASALCSDKGISIRDASSVDLGSLIKMEVFWDYGNDPTIKTLDNSPTAGEIYTHTYPVFFTPASRTVTIRYVVYSGENCINSFTRTLELFALPQVQFGNIAPVCEDVAAFQVTQAQVTNGLPGSGLFSGNGISATGIFNPATAGFGQHTITYTFTGTNGCIGSATNIIEVNPKPAVNAGPDKVVLQGGSVTLTPSQNIGIPVTYLWTPPTGLNNLVIANPSASPAEDITYTLTVTSDKGCITSDQVFVKVLKTPTIPNIFSPNGDNVHDRWEIPYLESYPGCTIDIYNRYGQLVYHSVGYLRPWDGKVNGRDVPVGTYYYVIDPKNGRTKMAGYVDVIR